MQNSIKKKFRTEGTKDGLHSWDAEIIRTDCNHPIYPVLVLITDDDGTQWPETYTKDLKSRVGQVSALDLVEINPYADLAVDAPVICWANPVDGVSVRHKRHFANISCEGKAVTFPRGKSSFTIEMEELPELWDNCVPYEEYLDMQKQKENASAI